MSVCGGAATAKRSRNLSNQLTAGVARVDITPPPGFRMQGAMRRTEGARGVESRLSATALLLADDSTKIAIVDCDLVGFDVPTADAMRAAIGEAVQTPAFQVILGCTHTHNGPCTHRLALGGPHHVAARPGEVEALDAYVEDLQNKLVAVCREADQGRQAARAGAGSDHAEVAVNREEVAADGRVLVGRNPDGVNDRAVDVLRIDQLNGTPIAVVVGYAAHPVVMGYQIYEISTDYPGVVRSAVENATGATCMFLTGAAGNQACWSFLQSDWGEKERAGGEIAAAALKAFYRIETRPHRVIRDEGKSLSAVALYRKEFEDGPTHHTLRAAYRPVAVALQELPNLPTAEEQLRVAEQQLETLRGAGAETAQTAPQEIVVSWARGVLELVRAGEATPDAAYEIVGVRLDDFVLVGMQGEPFVEIGLSAKERSRARHTMFAGYVNGVVGYLPTDETIRQGGMAVSAAVRSYNLPAPPALGTADHLVGEIGKVLAELGV